MVQHHREKSDLNVEYTEMKEDKRDWKMIGKRKNRKIYCWHNKRYNHVDLILGYNGGSRIIVTINGSKINLICLPCRCKKLASLHALQAYYLHVHVLSNIITHILGLLTWVNVCQFTLVNIVSYHDCKQDFPSWGAPNYSPGVSFLWRSMKGIFLQWVGSKWIPTKMSAGIYMWLFLHCGFLQA